MASGSRLNSRTQATIQYTDIIDELQEISHHTSTVARRASRDWLKQVQSFQVAVKDYRTAHPNSRPNTEMRGWYENYFRALEDGCVEAADIHAAMANVTANVLRFQRDCRRTGRMGRPTFKTQMERIETAQQMAREGLEKLKLVVETARQCLEDAKAGFDNTE
ncbi:hypothetical protein TWF694_007647 [Orbilia ellipsospora]|uniref:Uncharacterized protein n=1 Tax=Orbilia ellipsospora TaxID=2528407 RepID=A0AAV9XID2_9PEZI